MHPRAARPRLLVQRFFSNIRIQFTSVEHLKNLYKTPHLPVALSSPKQLCNPKAKPDASSRSQLHQPSLGLCFYGAIDGRNSCRIIAPHPEAPSTLRQPYLRRSHGDRGRACVCKPIFPCLIYILHSCKIMLRVFW